MKLGTRPRYALRLMLELARLGAGGEPVSLATVAGRTRLSRSYLEQLAASLRNRQLVRAQCGKAGGYRLARPPDEITVGQIVEAADGPTNIVECVGDPLSCLLSETCECRPVYELISRRIGEVLHGVTLAQMLDPAWRRAMKAREAVPAGTDDLRRPVSVER